MLVIALTHVGSSADMSHKAPHTSGLDQYQAKRPQHRRGQHRRPVHCPPGMIRRQSGSTFKTFTHKTVRSLCHRARTAAATLATQHRCPRLTLLLSLQSARALCAARAALPARSEGVVGLSGEPTQLCLLCAPGPDARRERHRQRSYVSLSKCTSAAWRARARRSWTGRHEA